MESKKLLHTVSFLLVVIGAVNWGLIGLLGTNLLETVLVSAPSFVKIVYVLVGLAGVYLVIEHKIVCRYCGKGKK